MKRLNFLKRGLGLYLCALSFLFFELSSIACFAGVIYEYREEGSVAVIGTLEIQSPPASASSGWSTTAESDLIALFLDNAVFGLGSGNVLSLGGTLGLSEISSFNGTRLDGGSIGITFPTIFPSDPSDPTIDRSLSIQFAVPQGGDFIGLVTVETFPDGQPVVGDLFKFGDWVAQGTAVVPEPSTLTLLGVGLLGVGLMGYRKRRRSVNA
ncbi:MAG TPA: PEP-CTERM sorting domain-containing protein [Nitrospirales bacterium]|nr:PEP-CTERM sorting domain-containing protein [Nitrospirales bacterium]